MPITETSVLIPRRWTASSFHMRTSTIPASFRISLSWASKAMSIVRLLRGTSVHLCSRTRRSFRNRMCACIIRRSTSSTRIRRRARPIRSSRSIPRTMSTKPCGSLLLTTTTADSVSLTTCCSRSPTPVTCSVAPSAPSRSTKKISLSVNEVNGLSVITVCQSKTICQRSGLSSVGNA